MTAAIRKMQWERRLRENLVEMERQVTRVEEVQDAFYEGVAAADRLFDSAIGGDPLELWKLSQSRKRLFAGPPVPVHLSTKASAAGYPVCQCRRPGWCGARPIKPRRTGTRHG